MHKAADDYMYRAPWPSHMPLHVTTSPAQQRIHALRQNAEYINQQLRQHEAYRMAQTTENFGGPGTQRSRYIRAVMTTPYSVNPMLPYMAGGGMGPMGIPPGAGVYNQPTADLDIRPGQPDPEMTALETGITRTASVRFGDRVGRELAKVANEYEQEIPPQYVQAVAPPPTQAQSAGKSLAGAVSHLGKGLGEGAMAAGHGVRAVSGALGRGVSGVAQGVREFMSQESQGNHRWGLGMPPAAYTNEYGQPIYG